MNSSRYRHSWEIYFLKNHAPKIIAFMGKRTGPDHSKSMQLCNQNTNKADNLLLLSQPCSRPDLQLLWCRFGSAAENNVHLKITWTTSEGSSLRLDAAQRKKKCTKTLDWKCWIISTKTIQLEVKRWANGGGMPLGWAQEVRPVTSPKLPKDGDVPLQERRGDAGTDFSCLLE